jgi:pseudouridine-5'-phosphate glycosidase
VAPACLGLGLSSGILVTVPLPEELALPTGEVAAAVGEAEAAAAAGVHGPASTPFVLARVAELTGGRSVRASLALIERDAHVAGRIAVALAGPAAG